MKITDQITVREISLNGQRIKLVKLPVELCANGWSTPKLYWKTIHNMEAQKRDIVLECRKLRGLIQDIETD
jgi:hypothetical protein